MQKIGVSFVLTLAFLMAACVGAPKENATKNPTAAANKDPNRRIKIGFSMATVKEERWQRDRDAFEAHCKKMNAECEITVADNSKEKQVNDVDNLLTKRVDVLVIAPDDATQAASMVEKAKAKTCRLSAMTD